MKYVLTLQEALGEEGTNKLPPAFLMEMMEMNEGLMELEFDPEPTAIANIQALLEKKEAELSNNVAPLLDRFDANPTSNEGLEKVVDYYLKKRYLLRIRENLGKFVGWKYHHALVAELVDALDSKSSSFGSEGSIPSGGTLNFL